MSTFEWSQLATRVNALEKRQSNIDTHLDARVSALEQRQSNTDARIDAKMNALERRQSNLETSIEEVDRDATTNFNHLSYDMTASFKKLTEYLAQIEDNNEKRFQSIETTLGEHSGILGEHSRILGEHSQRLERIETTLDDHTKRFDRVETLLTQILARLPENR